MMPTEQVKTTRKHVAAPELFVESKKLMKLVDAEFSEDLKKSNSAAAGYISRFTKDFILCWEREGNALAICNVIPLREGREMPEVV